MKAFNFILLALFLSLTANGQGVVISVTGPYGREGIIGVGSNMPPAGVSWTATSAFTDISIFLEMQSPPGLSNIIAMAYLTTSVGPGTTTADQVASASFSIPTTASLIPVLSGLTLGAGTYYLVVQGLTIDLSYQQPYHANWYTAAYSETITTAPSISLNPSLFTQTMSGGYPPASQFSELFNGGVQFQYTVTGYAVPEPSTLSLLGVIGVPVFLFRRRT
jgi:hypothetical protein